MAGCIDAFQYSSTIAACSSVIPSGNYTLRYGSSDYYATAFLQQDIRMVLLPQSEDNELHQRFIVAYDAFRGCYALTIADEPSLAVTYSTNPQFNSYLLLKATEPSCFCFIPQPDSENLYKIQARDMDTEEAAFVTQSLARIFPPLLALGPFSSEQFWKLD